MKIKIPKGWYRVKEGLIKRGDMFDYKFIAGGMKWYPCEASIGELARTFLGKIIRLKPAK